MQPSEHSQLRKRAHELEARRAKFRRAFTRALVALRGGDQVKTGPEVHGRPTATVAGPISKVDGHYGVTIELPGQQGRQRWIPATAFVPVGLLEESREIAREERALRAAAVVAGDRFSWSHGIPDRCEFPVLYCGKRLAARRVMDPSGVMVYALISPVTGEFVIHAPGRHLNPLYGMPRA